MIDDRILKIISKDELESIKKLKILIVGVGGVGGAIIGGIALLGGALAALPAVGVGVGIAAVGTLIGSFFN